MGSIMSGSANFGWPQLFVKAEKLVELTESLVSLGFGYELGAKILPLSLQAPGVFGTTENGSHGKVVDCSGFVRWAIYHATAGTGEALAIPDGSANQHEWFETQGFKRSDYAAGHLKDGVIRVGFLSPEKGGGIGHVVLILNGRTLESHGGHGPDRRDWNAAFYPFMADMDVFVASLG